MKYKIVIKKNRNGQWNWTQVSRRGGKVVCTSNQGFATRAGALRQGRIQATDLAYGCNGVQICEEVAGTEKVLAEIEAIVL